MIRPKRTPQQRGEGPRGAVWWSLALSVISSWTGKWGKTPIWIGGLAVLVAGSIAPAVEAQSSADSYFHEAAQQYVEGNTAAARRAVEEGLETDPSDPRLIALRRKLQQAGRAGGSEEQGPSSSNSGENAQQDNTPSSDDASSDEEKASSSDDGGRTPPGRQDPGTSSTRAGARSSSQQMDDAQGRADTLGRRGRGQPVDSLSREQAERLLRALEGQERQLLRRLQSRSSKRRTVEKDW